jgi:hypothetical protein
MGSRVSDVVPAVLTRWCCADLRASRRRRTARSAAPPVAISVSDARHWIRHRSILLPELLFLPLTVPSVVTSFSSGFGIGFLS